METIEALRHQFAYNEWANRCVFDALGKPENQSPKAVRLFAHLLVTEKMYLLRILRDEDTTGFDFWQHSTLAECEALMGENSSAYGAFLRDLTEEDLSRVATYKNSKGIEYRNTYREMLTHVLAHSAYHRGQVASAVRMDGGTPAYTDYIAFLREQEQTASFHERAG